MEPTPEPRRTVSAARAHLDRGFRFEQGGALERALDAYRAAMGASPTPLESVEAHIRVARVHRVLTNWTQAHEEAATAVRLAEEIGEDDLVAEALNVEMGALQTQGFFDQADEMGKRALALARS